MSIDSVPDDQRPELAAIMADDELLDALGRGDPDLADEPVAALLAAWRADLSTDVADLSTDVPEVGHGGSADPSAVDPAGPDIVATATATATGPDAGLDGAARRTGRPGRRRRQRGWAVGVAAAAVGVLLVGAGAQHAGPGNPLWPVTRAVFPERADVREVEEAIDLARTAVRAGRYDDARAGLDDAAGRLARVRDPDEVARLQQDIDDVRRTLAGSVSPTDRSGPASPSPSGPTPAGGRPSAGKPAGPGPSGAPPASGQPGLLPSLLPLPPLPLPSLPPLLPSPTPTPTHRDCPLFCLFG